MPDYFPRDKNRRNSFSKEFRCSCDINKFRTGTLCRMLNYSAEHLKIPGNYTIGSCLLRIEKKNVIFSGSKQIPQCYPRKTCKSLPKRLILPSIFLGCFEFVFEDYTPEHVKYPTQKGRFLKRTETVAQICSVKEVRLEISQNSLENTSAGLQLY